MERVSAAREEGSNRGRIWKLTHVVSAVSGGVGSALCTLYDIVSQLIARSINNLTFSREAVPRAWRIPRVCVSVLPQLIGIGAVYSCTSILCSAAHNRSAISHIRRRGVNRVAAFIVCSRALAQLWINDVRRVLCREREFPFRARNLHYTAEAVQLPARLLRMA